MTPETGRPTAPLGATVIEPTPIDSIDEAGPKGYAPCTSGPLAGPDHRRNFQRPGPEAAVSPRELGAGSDPGNDPVHIDLGSSSITIWCPAPEHRTLRLAGEIDMATVPQLRLCVLELLEAKPRSLVLDFSDVTFIGSAGLALLIETRNLADKQATTFHLTNLTHDLARLLDITGLVEMFNTDTPTANPNCHDQTRR